MLMQQSNKPSLTLKRPSVKLASASGTLVKRHAKRRSANAKLKLKPEHRACLNVQAKLKMKPRLTTDRPWSRSVKPWRLKCKT